MEEAGFGKCGEGLQVGDSRCGFGAMLNAGGMPLLAGGSNEGEALNDKYGLACGSMESEVLKRNNHRSLRRARCLLDGMRDAKEKRERMIKDRFAGGSNEGEALNDKYGLAGGSVE
jgi:hypothetical protein